MTNRFGVEQKASGRASILRTNRAGSTPSLCKETTLGLLYSYIQLRDTVHTNWMFSRRYSPLDSTFHHLYHEDTRAAEKSNI